MLKSGGSFRVLLAETVVDRADNASERIGSTLDEILVYSQLLRSQRHILRPFGTTMA